MIKRELRIAILKGMRIGLRITGNSGRRLAIEALQRGDEFLHEDIETISTKRGDLLFCCPTDFSLWRARTLLTKEPETIEWIDGFQDGDTFWDVGANIGMYSLYAAISRKLNVLAFEPSAANYFLLNRNIEKNGLSEVLHAYCIAFSDTTSADTLNMQMTCVGGAMSGFGVTTNDSGAEFVPIFRQGMIGYSIDNFIERFGPAFPNHIKIDVDGIEDRIVSGAKTTLSDKRLKSISVELNASNPEAVAKMTNVLAAAELALIWKRQTDMFVGNDIFNYHFRRPS